MSGFLPEQIGVLINAKAGRGTHNEHLKRWARKHDVTVWETYNLDDAERALHECADRSFSLLVIAGGDGTIDAIIRLMREQNIFVVEPSLLALPAGTTNMTARDITGTSSYKKAIKNLDKITASNINTKRNVLKIKGASGQVLYGFFFGGGAIPLLINETKDKLHKKGMTGPVGQFFMIIKSLISLWRGRVDGHRFYAPASLRISAATKEGDYNSVFFIISVLENLLLDLKPAIPKDGKMSLLSLNAPYKNLSNHIKDLLSGDKEICDGQPVLRVFEEKISLAFDGQWTLDGEIFSANAVNPLEIKVDKAVTFLQI